ncbi:uncharacterized protein L969DRAFT_605753 [Mixia osmundae IAM 14324]|uniref:Uncharacterized protein n=1 Tax=Mixia osmundae (strain CBS 9802 / IAM 14324 / JCM 22182 / KY 12970) TaxID=764103 RepID=G7E032_MIXOS|nr:uncharacterized protein L969DRAFT_605753 [Mixia osmundae IAM 14324]KEI42185.1 hypothetical protein L969DRAFT_605753 [Mixia osmundae IAM 14324]GAA96192.1 hypothetical protein E5Q_02856 [Mixia osmundae IAM 14324]
MRISSQRWSVWLALSSLACLAVGQGLTNTEGVQTSVIDGTTVTFYSAPTTFIPTASGASASQVSTTTLTNVNSANGGFSYSIPLSTIPPTGTLTQAASGSASNLLPVTNNLQSAPAKRLVAPSFGLPTGLMALVSLGIATGAAIVLA